MTSTVLQIGQWQRSWFNLWPRQPFLSSEEWILTWNLHSGFNQWHQILLLVACRYQQEAYEEQFGWHRQHPNRVRKKTSNSVWLKLEQFSIEIRTEIHKCNTECQLLLEFTDTFYCWIYQKLSTEVNSSNISQGWTVRTKGDIKLRSFAAETDFMSFYVTVLMSFRDIIA